MGSSGDLQETAVLQQGGRTWGPKEGGGSGRWGGCYVSKRICKIHRHIPTPPPPPPESEI